MVRDGATQTTPLYNEPYLCIGNCKPQCVSFDREEALAAMLNLQGRQPADMWKPLVPFDCYNFSSPWNLS